MDETVYQCPECNFNADNLNELDSHIIENHSNEINNPLNGNLLKPNSNHINKNYTNGYNQNNDDNLDDDEYDQDNENFNNVLDDVDDDEEDFFNERSNHKNGHNNYQNGNSTYHNELDENGYEINETNEHVIDEEEEDFFGNQTQNDYTLNENNSSQINANMSINISQNSQATKTNRTGSSNPKINIQHVNGPVINSDNHYERQYACKRCDFFTNNPRAVLYHRKEFHMEKINVHECQFCQYASQYSGKVERHTLLRHKIDVNTSKLMKSIKQDDAQNLDPATANGSDLNLKTSDHTSTNQQAQSQQQTNNQIAKFQCNKCPCKYKRSSDLTKHLRLKHSVNPNSLNDYLKMNNSQNNSQINNPNEDMENEDLENSNNKSLNLSQTQIQIQNSTNPNTSLNRSYLNRNFNQIQKKIINEIETNNQSISQPHANPNPNQYQCPYCTYNASLENPSEYLLHVKDHLCGKTFRCVLCNSVYKYRGDCVVHLKRKHQKADMIAHSYVDKFNLDNLEINDIYGLLKPKEIDEPENDEKLFGCSYCDYKANYKGDVYKHQTRRHPGTVKSVLSLTTQNLTVLSNCSNQSSENNSANNSFNLNTTSNQNNMTLNQTTNEDYYTDNNNENIVNTNNQIIIDEEDQEDNYMNDLEDDEEDFFNERTQNNIDEKQDFEAVEEEEEKLAQIHPNFQDYQTITQNNLKLFMCPICKHRANFKWDIQKHMRKVHNDFQSEVVCLTEIEARKLINTNIYTNKLTNENSNSNIDGVSSSTSNLSCSQSKLQSNLNQTALGLPERKYKCSLCMRTSKWQWDIKKHLRTVHKGLEGDVVVLEEKDLNIPNNVPIHPNLNTSLPINMNKNTAQSSPLIYNGVNMNQTTIGSDTTGNKKFRCTICPYRSNWKADMYRHLRKRHTIAQPKIEDVVVLTPEEAASTLEEYERLHGINIRKRARFDADVYKPVLNTNFNQSSNDGYGSIDIEAKRFKNETGSIISTSESNEANNYGTPGTEDEIMDSESHETNIESSSNDNHGYESDQMNPQTTQGLSQNNGVDRLPVSIAELNIKPYKCLKCGFRSDRKSDTLRHIRVKHALQPIHAFKFLRILSIKEASETIDEYESTRLYKKVKPNNRDYALINTLVQQTSQSQNLDPSTALSSLRQLNKTQTPQPQNSLSSQFIKTNPVQIHRPNPLNSQYSTRSNVGLNLPNNANKIENNTSKHEQTKSNKTIEYFRCPFCSFKNISRCVIKKHLANHYFANNNQNLNIFKCSLCNFKSEWQYTCKKHILTTHMGSANATVIKINRKKLDKKRKTISQNSCEIGKSIKIVIKRDENGENTAQISEPLSESEPEINNNADIKQEKVHYNVKYNFYNAQNEDNEDFIHYEDDTEDQLIEEHAIENDFDKKDFNQNVSLNESEKMPESIVLTGYDGQQFTTHYLVSSSSVTVTGINGPVSQKKKIFFCQMCPYKTNNYCNLKQHLLLHRFRDGFFKCRYCPYYVSMIRLLKQHEILHSEYLPRENCSLNNSIDVSSSQEVNLTGSNITIKHPYASNSPIKQK